MNYFFIHFLAFFALMGSASADVETPIPEFKKVVWIWLENTPDQLMRHEQYAHYLWTNYPSVRFTQMLPVSPVTQANSFALVAGNDFGIKDNNLIRIFQPTLVDLLEAQHMPWRTYAEQYAGSCDLNEGVGDYKRYRVPFLSVSQIQTDRYLCSKIVGFKFLDDDLKYNTLPRFSLVIPSLKGSGATSGTNAAENTLRRVIDPIISNPDLFNEVTIFITTTNNSDPKNPFLYTMILGNNVADYAMLVKEPYNHYHILRTIEEGLLLGTLKQNDEKVAPLTGFWK